MIQQHQHQAIRRRQKAIGVFLVLDDASEGENHAIHQQIYEALARGESISAFASKSLTFSTKEVASWH